MISAALEVDVTKDWFDYLVAVATAAGTVGAVLVAVLWPGIHARRRRPVLSLRAETYAKGNTYRLGEDLAEDAMTLIAGSRPSSLSRYAQRLARLMILKARHLSPSIGNNFPQQSEPRS